MRMKWSVYQCAGMTMLALFAGLAVATVFESQVDSILVDKESAKNSNTAILISGLLLLPVAGILHHIFKEKAPGIAGIGAIALAAAGITLTMVAAMGFAFGELTKIVASPDDIPLFAIRVQAGAIIRQFAIISGLTQFAIGLAAFGAVILRGAPGHRILGWHAIATAVLIPFMWINPTESPLWGIGYVAFGSLLLWVLLTGLWLTLYKDKAKA